MWSNDVFTWPFNCDTSHVLSLSYLIAAHKSDASRPRCQTCLLYKSRLKWSANVQHINLKILLFRRAERWHFWRSEISIDYRLIQCIRSDCSSPLSIFVFSLHVYWFDSWDFTQYMTCHHKIMKLKITLKSPTALKKHWHHTEKLHKR